MATEDPLFCTVETARFNGKDMLVLVPNDRKSAGRLAKVRRGKLLEIETASHRNPKQLRLYWAMMDLIAANVERFTDSKHVSYEIKMNTGHVERRQISIPGLGIVFQEWPASIAIDAMEQAKFAPWFSSAINYVTTNIWPGMPADAIRAELADMLGVDDWPERKEKRQKEPA